ncbi:MAG: DNA-3-methyladenine glycosylase [Nitrososphaerales archaeon]
MARLGRSFYSRYTPDVARDLIGATLVRKVDGKVLTGRIVEVEAYRGADDPASHAYRGLTRRTAVMFGKAGRAYVYLAYGVNYCLNLTTEAEGEPGAVLIRAVEPIEGVEEMLLRRGVQDVTRVARGPGNLTRALGIDLQLNGEDLVTSRGLYLLEGRREEAISVSTRIGVGSGRGTMWRFYVEASPFVSGNRSRRGPLVGPG